MKNHRRGSVENGKDSVWPYHKKTFLSDVYYNSPKLINPGNGMT